ncbi:MAG: DUF721 domain-containing protein [Brumimicrobium sp.]|nr:DUF721 domain-containing protein [Brumimicrobium sp.]
MNDKKRSSQNQDIGSVIDKMLKAYGLDGKMKEMDVINSWEEMMGKAVANRTEKIFIQNKILHLQINSSVMRDELLFGKQVIIERVNQKAGFQLITDVWFG